MNFRLPPVIGLSLAAVFAIAALVLWWVLVRPVPEQTAVGIVRDVTFAEAEVVERTTTRNMRGLEYAPKTTRYRVPKRRIYDIELVGRQSVRYPDYSPHARFEIGAHVIVTYYVRKLPWVWERAYVRQVLPQS